RNASSSLNDAIASQALHLYPNPVSEVLSLGWKQEGRELPELVEIHDATGRLIMRRNASELNTGSTITVSVKDLASGTYQVTLTTNKNRYTRAFVVAH
ncbi:MAG: T9SS type A sorting domain-containing protein, partial [Bacteroidia bacterium]|nr:T9SS type A sorting domain-containing protein [Bacteroidia bacterium]